VVLTASPGSNPTAIGSDTTARGVILNDDTAPADGGRTINSSQYGDTLTGGSGNDTLNAGRGPDVLTGGGGGDVFAYHDLPWNSGRVTDFSVGSDRIDLSALFQASGYTGTDPIADGYVHLEADGSGGAYLFYDTDGRASGNTIQFRIADLEHVSPSASWAQLSGGGTTPPPAGAVNFATTSVSHAEGDSGTTAYSFTITRSGDVSQGATTSYQIVGSGAHPADAGDVQGLGGGGTFAWGAGESSHVLTVNVVGDSSVESDETFSVVLSTPGAGNSNPTPVGPNGTATGTIVNDDTASAENGRVITSSQYGDTLAGGSGADTLNAGQGPDRLTGGGGADLFVFGKEPWNAGHVTDFTPGVDKLDFRQIFAHSTYQGTDPVGAHVLEFRSDGAGNTQVYIDHDDPNGGDWPFLITTLDGVSPGQIGSGDFIFH
jgi:Ca2+-binding RTX toxin-like protein